MPADGLKTDKFGLLAGKNYSVDGRIRVNTGSYDLSQLGQIRSFNENEFYNVWPDTKCDKLKGGDGSFMSPSMHLGTQLDINVMDLCRSIRLIANHTVRVGHLNGIRFFPDPDLFNYDAPENVCYCPSKADPGMKIAILI